MCDKIKIGKMLYASVAQLDRASVFGFATLTIANFENISIYKHFMKLQKLKISIWHPKGTHFVWVKIGVKCIISPSGEMDIT